MLVKFFSYFSVLCQLIRILFVFILKCRKGFVLATHYVQERIQLGLDLLLIILTIPLTLLSLSLQMCSLFLHLLLKLLHLVLPFGKDLAYFSGQMRLFLSKQLLEFFLIVSLLQLNFLYLFIELSPTLVQLLSQSLFLALQLLNMVSHVVSFFLDLSDLFAYLAGYLGLELA